jgi:hypothetical protein
LLSRLKTFFAPTQPPAIDAVFHARFPERFQINQFQHESGGLVYGAVGSAPWFNARSESDRNLLMRTPTHLLETDDPQVLANIGSARYAPHHEFILYQPWREPVAGGNVRLLGTLTREMSPAIGAALAGSPVKHFFLITGGIGSGALTALRDSLQGHRLLTLGLFWYYSGDDMTDDPRVVEEIVSLCQASQTERLSLLTAAVDSAVEDRLVKGFTEVPSLRECSVFEKDDHARYPRFRTPGLDALLRNRA